MSFVFDEGEVLAGIITHQKLADTVEMVASHCGCNEGVSKAGMCGPVIFVVRHFHKSHRQVNVEPGSNFSKRGQPNLSVSQFHVGPRSQNV